MTNLLELAERVEALTGPDREVDAEIWLACVPGATRKVRSYTHKDTGRVCVIDETRDASRKLIIVPSFTASLDAAMSLVPEGWWTFVAMEARHSNSWRWDLRGDFGLTGEARAATPALALCAAALRARHAMSSKDA